MISSDISKLLYIISRAGGRRVKFETILKYHDWYLGQISRTNRAINCLQLFRGRLSEKVHATIPKGIMGGFEFTVLQINFKKWHERPWTYV